MNKTTMNKTKSRRGKRASLTRSALYVVAGATICLAAVILLTRDSAVSVAHKLLFYLGPSLPVFAVLVIWGVATLDRMRYAVTEDEIELCRIHLTRVAGGCGIAGVGFTMLGLSMMVGDLVALTETASTSSLGAIAPVLGNMAIVFASSLVGYPLGYGFLYLCDLAHFRATVGLSAKEKPSLEEGVKVTIPGIVTSRQPAPGLGG